MTLRTIAATLATATALTGVAAVPARAEITTLGECYDAVLKWCNETFPDMDCSNAGGLDECDEVFGDKSNSGKTFKLTLPRPGGRASIYYIRMRGVEGESESGGGGRPHRESRPDVPPPPPGGSAPGGGSQPGTATLHTSGPVDPARP